MGCLKSTLKLEIRVYIYNIVLSYSSYGKYKGAYKGKNYKRSNKDKRVEFAPKD